MQDKELLNKIKSGDINAFKQLFETYQASIYNLCYRFVGTEEEAEDLCQEVFFKIYRAARTFKHKSKLSTWIYRITVNLCLNYKRKHKRFNFLTLDNTEDKSQHKPTDLSIPPADHPDIILEQKEKELIVQKAINSLPKNQRLALILQRYEGMSIQEIAELLDCTASSIQSRLARAKENLAKKLLPYFKDI